MKTRTEPEPGPPNAKDPNRHGGVCASGGRSMALVAVGGHPAPRRAVPGACSERLAALPADLLPLRSFGVAADHAVVSRLDRPSCRCRRRSGIGRNWLPLQLAASVARPDGLALGPVIHVVPPGHRCVFGADVSVEVQQLPVCDLAFPSITSSSAWTVASAAAMSSAR